MAHTRHKDKASLSWALAIATILIAICYSANARGVPSSTSMLDTDNDTIASSDYGSFEDDGIINVTIDTFNVSNKIYGLNGVKVTNRKPGCIYIVGGKKYILHENKQ